MFHRVCPVAIAFLLISAITACGPSESVLQTATAQTAQALQTAVAETLTAEPTDTPKPTLTYTPTVTPTETATITPTPTITLTPTSTPAPQPLLLRKVCGTSYVVKAGQPIKLFYGAWGVFGLDLAQQWTTNLTVDLTIDGNSVKGYQQPPTTQLPYNCKSIAAGVYILYYMTVLPELAPGAHNVKVTIKALAALSDGAAVYGPGLLDEQTFTITVK